MNIEIRIFFINSNYTFAGLIHTYMTSDFITYPLPSSNTIRLSHGPFNVTQANLADPLDYIIETTNRYKKLPY